MITSADPDHLDIYHTPEAYRESFEHFTSLVSAEGALVMKKGIPVTPRLKEGTRLSPIPLELTKRTSVPTASRSVMGISSSTGTIPLSKGARRYAPRRARRTPSSSMWRMPWQLWP